MVVLKCKDLPVCCSADIPHYKIYLKILKERDKHTVSKSRLQGYVRSKERNTTGAHWQILPNMDTTITQNGGLQQQLST